MRERSLFINESFALRQKDGMPVFTSIKTIEAPYQESEIDSIISNLNKQRKVLGLTPTQSFDTRYNEILRKTPKKNRVKTDYPINLSETRRIFITPTGKVYISTYFLDFCKVHKISIYFVDTKGKIEASFIPFHYLKSSLGLKQYKARTNRKGLEIAKYLIMLKLESMGMKDLIPNLRNAEDLRGAFSVEAMATTRYFSDWSFPEEWNFRGRRNKNVRTRKNKHATDPINTMLNFGYGLVAQQTSEFLLAKGFELSIGFIHQSEGGNRYWNMLAYDFIEPFRVWIDECVKEMIADKVIRPADFRG